MILKKFSAYIRHNQETVRLLFKTAYYTYHKKLIIYKLVLGILLNLIALTSDFSKTVQALLMMLGCMLIVSKDFLHHARSDEVIQSRKAHLPEMKTDFYENHFQIIGENGGKIEYSKIDRLVRHGKYAFLFVSQDVVCMMDEKTLLPMKTAEFEDFIEKKTNKKFRIHKGPLSLSLYDLIPRNKRSPL